MRSENGTLLDRFASRTGPGTKLTKTGWVATLLIFRPTEVRRLSLHCVTVCLHKATTLMQDAVNYFQGSIEGLRLVLIFRPTEGRRVSLQSLILQVLLSL